MRNVLEIDGVNVSYENVEALSNINLRVKENDFLAIIGPNGGGKSTLLKTILGLLKPDSGEIKIFGQSNAKTFGLIGYVPQFSKFNKNFPISVKDVVIMGFLKNNNKMFAKLKPLEEKKAETIMKNLNIFEFKERQIGQLSGGQLQRVLIARALAVGPKILLLDEPTASLDSNVKSQIYHILKELNEKMTIIMVTHDMGAISSYVKSIACLNRKLFYHGAPKLTKDILSQVYGCPIDMIAHGISHRVFHEHKEDQNA
ncbi:metal ABC transporter ATP-binding protein [Marinisporobacter balticus]|uniref:Zinc transport system ATP-binding protein n=1 Tax=Marinisporobacter balticus TaxID=2018667 RepID=A0A4R2KQJ6_9FIRM|nr:metal ABC transporter ATP-binding protein [Marinisporobacter balticus]TCO74957.1 zinc transport system ATP-binding protein [Marinisporobacter balticus]